MLIRQSKDTFIRCTEHYGYITNQVTRFDRVYDENGAAFLRHISRAARPVEEIIEAIACDYKDCNIPELTADFMDFVLELESVKFIVMGNSIEEIESKDIGFTYNCQNPKTIKDLFIQETPYKISENTQDFFLEEIQGRPLISALQLEISSKCNERCIHCYIPSQKKDQGINMPYALFTRIIDEFADMGGIHVTLSGGEAFLHPRISDMLYYCRDKDLKITVLSNLINLKDENLIALKNTNVSLIQVSLYSMDESVHDSITMVKGSFFKTKQSIEKLVAADIPVQISCPLMKANKSGYKEVLLYAQSLKIKAYTDYIMMAQSDLDTSNLSNRLSLDETELVLRDIMNYDIDYDKYLESTKPIENNNLSRERFLKQPVCGVGYDNCCISANGDVFPCAGWQGYVLGNICKESLKHIWENSYRIKTLRQITESSFPKCISCEARQYCSRCLVRNYNESNGDMFTINKHFCDVAFLTKRLAEEIFGPKIEELKKLYEPGNSKDENS